MDAPGIRARNRHLAARRGLADRGEFHLDPEALDAWEGINQRPARSLKGLSALMDRPPAFQD